MVRDKIVIGVSTRAIFDLREEHELFIEKGIESYNEIQKKREDVLLRKGEAFHVIEKLLKINEEFGDEVVKVVIISRNSPEISLRVFKSLRAYGMNVTMGSFTSGRNVSFSCKAWEVDLFLSNEIKDVEAVLCNDMAAAIFGEYGSDEKEEKIGGADLRVVFDGDSVVFDSKSDEVYEEKGIEGFYENEMNNEDVPMGVGPFGRLLMKLSMVKKCLDKRRDGLKIKLSIVTARNAPAHARMIKTLRMWKVDVDEIHFVGSSDKSKFLKEIGADIFFDDKIENIMKASSVVASGRVVRVKK